ncbi:hypothetical protein C8R45DRAFT_364524 [Mycena sanguinolenta]|nr:hypothetical protein C8R45DRAFT_364524 [Mycena sanguinolenta]
MRGVLASSGFVMHTHAISIIASRRPRVRYDHGVRYNTSVCLHSWCSPSNLYAYSALSRWPLGAPFDTTARGNLQRQLPRKSYFCARKAFGFGIRIWQGRTTTRSFSTVKLPKLTPKVNFASDFGGVLCEQSEMPKRCRAIFYDIDELFLVSHTAWSISENSSSKIRVTGHRRGELNETLQYSAEGHRGPARCCPNHPIYKITYVCPSRSESTAPLFSISCRRVVATGRLIPDHAESLAETAIDYHEA